MARHLWFYVALLLTGAAQASEVAMVTALSGTAELHALGASAAMPLQAFVKLHQGDRLTLHEPVRLQLVFFANGTEQLWQGPGELQVLASGATAADAALQPQVRQLPRLLIKQLAKTPAPDGQIKAGMVRLRSMPSGETLESLEDNYAQLRSKADATDRNPELYLLAGYFELHEFDKLMQLLAQLDEQAPGNSEIAVLRGLYRRAIDNAKMAKKP